MSSSTSTTELSECSEDRTTSSNRSERNLYSGSVFTSRPSQNEIPSCTSMWNADHLAHLDIVALQSRTYPPRSLAGVDGESIERRVNKIKGHLIKYMPFGLKAIDFDDFYSINHEGCRSILYNAQKRQIPNRFRVEPLPDFEEEEWRELFNVNAELFCKHLIYMTWEREKGHTVSEYMFQQLFQHFTAMFGLHSIGVPCLEPQTLTIRGVAVSSPTDLVFYDLPNCDGKDRAKIFAICKVKSRQGSEFLEPSPHKSRRCDEEGTRQITHLDSSMIGQHGGDLLVHYASKACEQSQLLGFIVEGPNVTFTQFSCNEIDYEMFRRGELSFPDKAGPVIRFSKAYNILKAVDRMHLIEPLLKLGFRQSRLKKF